MPCTVPSFLNITFTCRNLWEIGSCFGPMLLQFPCSKLSNTINSSFLSHKHYLQRIFTTHLYLYDHPMRPLRQAVLFLLHRVRKEKLARGLSVLSKVMEKVWDTGLLIPRPAFFLLLLCCPMVIRHSLKTLACEPLEFHQSRF